MTMDEWERGRLRESLITGLNAENAETRIGLLIEDLKKHADDLDVRMLVYQLDGTIDEDPEPPLDRGDLSPLRGLIRALDRSIEVGVDVQDLLTWISGAPAHLVPRLQMWLLTRDHEEHRDRIINEIAMALKQRPPTGDDLRAIEGVASAENHADAIDTWKEAFPAPPPVSEVGKALAEEDLPDEWRRAWQWSGVLPSSVTEAWDDVKAVLDSRYGEMSPQRFKGPRMKTTSYTVGSPMSVDELRQLGVMEAADRISSWERDPYQHEVGYRELARVLTTVVAENPTAWAAQPVKTIARLREPIYISHYLRGLVEGVDGIPEDASPALIEAVEFVATSPWEPRSQGREGGWDYDPDWGPAFEEGIELIGAMASKDLGFGDRRPTAWDLLNMAVMNTERGSGISDPDHDPYTLALNRPCTKALMAVCHVMGFNFRESGQVDEEAYPILDWVIAQEGAEGEQFRAVLATRPGFLRHVVGDWLDANKDNLFGAAVDPDLGESALRSAMRWAGPNKWLMAEYPTEIQQLALDREERAMDIAMIAMVWGIEGFEPEGIAARFQGNPTVISDSGKRLGFVLRPDDVDVEFIDRAVDYWRHVIDAEGPPDRLRGFGWFSEVANVDDDVLRDLLLETSRLTEGNVEWWEGISKRISLPPTDARGLEVLTWLLRASTEPWAEQQIASRAMTAMQQADEGVKQADEYRDLRDWLLAKGYFAAEDL